MILFALKTYLGKYYYFKMLLFSLNINNSPGANISINLVPVIVVALKIDPGKYYLKMLISFLNKVLIISSGLMLRLI